MKFSLFAAALAAAATASAVAQSPTALRSLGLAEAVHIAEQSGDPGVQAWHRRSASLEALGRSENSRPDPVVRAGVNNLPLGDLDLNREAMTQGSLTVRQAFLRGETGSLRQARREAEAMGAQARAAERQRAIRRDVRESWLDAFYWQEARHLTLLRQEELALLGEAALATYASGRSTAADVIRTDLETAVLDTRLVDIDRQLQDAQSRLVRFVGPDGRRPLPRQLPSLPAGQNEESVEVQLARHPSVNVLDAAVQASNRAIELARQAFKPAWSVEAAYGLRDSRSDTASIGVSVAVPLFEREARHAGVASAREARSAAEMERQAVLLDLRRDWERLQVERRGQVTAIAVYERSVLPNARATVEAVMTAYENDGADFPELVRAQLAWLDIELEFLRLHVNARKAEAGLLYLVGEPQ
ncbi:TolC family protein [Maricaulis sp. CAU 1757]